MEAEEWLGQSERRNRMKVKKNAPLPPWVDVSGNANKDYWISPALPWMPVSDTDGRNDFSGIVLTALLH